MKAISFIKVLFFLSMSCGSLMAQDIIFSEDFRDDIRKEGDGACFFSESIKLLVSGDGLNSEESGVISILSSKTGNAQVLEWIPENPSLSSIAVSADDFKEVFRFQISDAGEDGVATILKTIRLIPGENNTMNWENGIVDFHLHINGELADVEFSKTETELLISFAYLDALAVIEDGNTSQLSLSLNLSEHTSDGAIFQMVIESLHSQWVVNGSDLRDEFTGSLEGASFTIDVVGTEFIFTDKPPKKLVPNTSFNIELKSVDKFGNQDVNSLVEAKVSLASGSGLLSSSFGLNRSLTDGKYVWSDLAYDKAENFTILVEADGMNSVLSDNISSLDANSIVVAAETTIVSKVLNPMATSLETSETIFNFTIKDEGSFDDASTLISSIKFYNTFPESGLDWYKHLAGACLRKNGEVIAKTTKIESKYISFTSLNLETANASQSNYELGVYFKKSLLPDHAKLQVKIRKDHNWKTSSTASALLDEFPVSIKSAIHSIEVEADRLSFISAPNGIYPAEAFSVIIAAVDAHHNIDRDKGSSLNLNLLSGKGTLSQSGTVGHLVNGVFIFDVLSYLGSDPFELIVSGDLTSATQSLFVQEDALVVSDDFESQDITSWENSFDWSSSSYLPISGTYSLKHNLTNAIGSSYIVRSLADIHPGTESIFWEFSLKNSDWDPSSTNHFVFHLLMDFNDPDLADNLFSVGVNMSGSDDKLSLWKTEDGDSEVLMKSDFDWSEDETIAIKLEYTAKGEWKLFYNRLGQKENWLKLGSSFSEITDCDESWYSGLEFNFKTASRAGELWFDNLKIEAYNTPPFLKTYTLISDSILLDFSEDLNFIESSKADNFELKRGGALVSIKEINATTKNNQILLITEKELVTGQYSLRINGIVDIEGAISQTENIELEFYAKAKAYDLVINEIFADESPTIGLPEYEFIEIYNTSDYPVNIKDYKLKVGSSEKILASAEIPAHAYLILCSSSASELYASYGNTSAVSSFPSLTNSGNSIQLESPTGLLIDALTYSNKWYGDDEKGDGGWSLERIDASNTCSTAGNWSASTNDLGGTPGTVNSIKGNYQDTEAPKLMSYVLRSNQSLQIEFSEAISGESALLLSNYSIGENSVLSVIKESVKAYRLEFEKAFSDGVNQSMTLINMTDECGNTQDISIGFIWHDVHPYDLVINEIYADESPTIGLPEYEFIEIYNTSDYPVNIKNYKLKVGSSEKVLVAAEIPAHAYLILCSGSAAELYASYGNTSAVSSFPSLTNSGTNIQLESPTGLLIDAVTYSNKWYGDDEKGDGGWSLERIDASNTCSTAGNWSASTNDSGGTPGTVNSIKEIYKDTEAPKLMSYVLRSNQSLQIEFSEAISGESALLLSNYGIGENSVLSVIKESVKAYRLEFEKAFSDGVNQSMTLSNMTDECGNTQEISIGFIWHDVHPYDLVINEIFADESPTIGLPEYEFIEIYNTSDYPVNIKDYKLKVGSSEKVLVTAEIPAHAYLILCSSSASELYASYGNTSAVSSFPSLTNSGSSIQLESPTGLLIDAVTYSSKWYGDNEKDDGGWSLERIDANNHSWQADNWKASLDKLGGTPGKENSISAVNPDIIYPCLLSLEVRGKHTLELFFSESLLSPQALSIQNYKVNLGLGLPIQVEEIEDDIFALRLTFYDEFEHNTQYTLSLSEVLVDIAGNPIEDGDFYFSIANLAQKGDVVINEVLFNPYPGGADYVELLNISDRMIDARDLYIANRDADYQLDALYRLSEKSRILAAGAYLLLSADTANVKLNYPSFDESAFIELNKMPTYRDDEGRVVILNSNNELLDDLAYNEDMQFTSFGSIEGTALERINPYAETNTAANWQSAAQTIGFGTPGLQNSSYDIDEVEVNVVGFKEKTFSPDSDGVNDKLIINFDLDKSGYFVNIRIYNSFGIEVRRLASNLSLATEDQLSWDGLLANHARSPLGIYIFYFELFHPDGEVKTYKKTCVLGGKLK